MIYRIVPRKGWAVVVKEDNVLIDNYHHGYPHIHPEREPIKYDDVYRVVEIVVKHIERSYADKVCQEASELIKEFERKYGSLEKLKRYLEKHPDNYVALMDYEDWVHCLKNPDIEIEEGKIIVTDVSFLTPQKLQILEAIRKFKPKSIRELAEKIGRDVKNVYLDVKELEKVGLVELRPSGRAKKVELKYNQIIITIGV